jgi:hypothetical protein
MGLSAEIEAIAGDLIATRPNAGLGLAASGSAGERVVKPQFSFSSA